MMSSKSIKLALWLFLALIVTIIGAFMLTSTQQFGVKSATKFSQLGGDFTVESINGSVSLSDFKDKIVVMYFGFLNCADVCPTSMKTIDSALKKLPQEMQNNIQVLLVSVDPHRDTVTDLAKYVDYYNSSFVGVTAEPEIIDQITKQYAAYYSVDASEQESEYEVSHSSKYYLINRQGQLVDAMRHSTTINELATRIELLYQQSFQG